MSASSQLKDWLAPPAPPRKAYPEPVLSKQRLSLDRYGSTPFHRSKAHDTNIVDLESQSSASRQEKPVRPSPISVSETSSIQRTRERPSLRARLKAWKPSKEILYNAILGTSDGMTVPFAVTASLAGVTDAKVVMMAGLAELIGGAISMAAGGVLGARTDVQKYIHISDALSKQIQNEPQALKSLIEGTFSPHLPSTTTDSIVTHISSLPEDSQLDFLLRFTPTYHDPSPPSTAGVWKIALVLGLGYFSGLVPLMPYMIVHRSQVATALYISVGVTAVALAAFGYGKTMLTLDGHSRPWECLMGSLECLFVVGVSAGLSVLIIRGVGGTL